MKNKPMHSLLALLILPTASLAQDYTKSPPFQLVIYSDYNDTINGTLLAACHEGAAIESLCITDLTPAGATPDSSTTFYHNLPVDASTNTTSTNLTDVSGSIGWDLLYAANQTAPSTVRFFAELTTDIAVSLVAPDPANEQGADVAFDACGWLYIELMLDDSSVPPGKQNGARLKNWYVCQTYWGYQYETLAWLVGVNGWTVPQNPTCQAVQVQRVFLS